jgi:hypothetical protein
MAGERDARGGERQGGVERDLLPGRADADTTHEQWPKAPDDLQPGHRHFATERVRHEVDGVPERGQCTDAMEL